MEESLMIRSLILFVHVIGVLGLFVGLALEGLSLDAARRSTARAEAVRWVRVSAAVPRMLGIALAIVPGVSFFLGARVGVLGQGWMVASYAALLIMAIVGGPVTRGGMLALRQAAEDQGDDNALRNVRAAVSNPTLGTSLRLRVIFGLAVVYLMIGKPDARASLVVLSLAAILAIAGTVLRRRYSSTLAEGYR
jgi:hypothetical protein